MYGKLICEVWPLKTIFFTYLVVFTPTKVGILVARRFAIWSVVCLFEKAMSLTLPSVTRVCILFLRGIAFIAASSCRKWTKVLVTDTLLSLLSTLSRNDCRRAAACASTSAWSSGALEMLSSDIVNIFYVTDIWTFLNQVLVCSVDVQSVEMWYAVHCSISLKYLGVYFDWQYFDSYLLCLKILPSLIQSALLFDTSIPTPSLAMRQRGHPNVSKSSAVIFLKAIVKIPN